MADMTHLESREQLEQIEKKILRTQAARVIATDDFVDPEVIYRELVARINRYHPNTDISMIEKAYEIARQAHKDQKRKSGEPYIIHPLSVALILADLELDKETIVGGLLHDVVEDTVMSLDDVRREFSDEIALLVDGVTKLGQLSYDADKVEIQAENLRKMFLAMSKDIRVLLIKLADRLHNMRTLKFMTPAKQKEKARETMEIYAPLAQRLGISKVKVELDDLALKFLEPDAYYDLLEQLNQRESERSEYIQSLADLVTRQIDAAGIKAKIYGRAKHLFSIYKKMVNQHKTLDQIYDLFAVRIIVDDLKDCYASLGIIHEHYTPIPGRFKDYIAMPKPNMYQSLHTTVIGPKGQPFEIQIRTWEMHRISEYGIAAHWKYKESGEGATTNQEEQKLSWLRQILEWQQDMTDNKEFVSLIKSDLNLFSDTVYCFTPTGDVKNLPAGSTPVDFAYSIHSAVGNRMVGAKVNGKLVPIDYGIQNGDRIEIITSQNSRGPSRDWVKLVKSSQARNKINQWFRAQSKDEDIQRGKELLMAYAKSHDIDFNAINRPEYQQKVLRRFGFHDWNNALATVGHGGLKEGQVINRLLENYRKDHPRILTDEDILASVKPQTPADGDLPEGASGSVHEHPENTQTRHHKSGIVVKGLHDVSVRFSKCCSPVPGDEIVGYITRGRGISIHRTDCVNMINLPDMEKNRLIEAEWEDGWSNPSGKLYDTVIKIYANNRVGILVDLSRVFSGADIDIEQMHSNTSRQGVATITIQFKVHGKEELRNLTEKLRQIESVVDIERTTGG